MSEKQQFDSALLTPKHWIAVAVILACGMVGGALILRAPQTATQTAAAVHAEDDDDDHDEEGVVELTEAQAKMIGIALAEAGPAVIRKDTLLPGEIRFDEDRTAHVVPRAAGVVESVHAQLGEQVKKDQLLAVIQSAAVADQRSELQTARQRLALAQTIYQREKQLWEEKISAEQDYLQARQALQEAEIAVRNASQRLSAIGVSVAATGGAAGVSRYELRAPFEGVVVEKHLTVGELVNESTASFTISDMRYVWAEMNVSAPQLPLVQVGAPVRVRATAFDASAEGKVAYVGALIGELTRTAAARVALANPQDLWRPGLFVNVEVMTEESQVPIAVKSKAIQWLDAQESVVFVLDDHGYKAQPVQMGRSDAEYTEILVGLSAGQTYVTEGAFMLKAELGKSSVDHGH
ncbi:efflux RND transporter periplasmic adaptor subunit [Lampropedia aestuarii]|uniref:efflux RND transporter periplasmic adaptor subunit n=1 Tax=Lampropedia aestuarii TaxID=2562762 RepID=UPI00246848F4|nr:efflux RND transporter periplasmic adaptor subunit [Lampropedia aestuarii]MDH5856813.1 efflux RND transporter periplasmic adaptor subunit [Lampropedia aestuarii]